MSGESKPPKYPILDEIEVPEDVLKNWQTTVDLLAEITASAMPEEAKKMKEAGFDGFLTKPINVKGFMQFVADVFSAKAAK